jgi:hypothetical protein
MRALCRRAPSSSLGRLQLRYGFDSDDTPVLGRNMRIHIIATTLATFLTLATTPAYSQTGRVVFEGQPLTKVSISFEGASTVRLTSDEAFKAQVRIVERNGRYFWQTRGMKELSRAESGAYITYSAVDGSGYIRVHIPMMLDLREKLPKDQRDREIGYSEHLLTQFASVTYFGNRVPPGAPSDR